MSSLFLRKILRSLFPLGNIFASSFDVVLLDDGLYQMSFRFLFQVYRLVILV